MKNKYLKISLSVGLFLFAGLALLISLNFELPAVGGPYPVGRAIFRWVDASRSEVLTPSSDDFREVMVLLWYPAVQDTGTKVGYFPNLPTVSKALAESGEMEAWQVAGLGLIRSNNNLDAEPVKDQSAFPIVIFSPGGGTNIELYSSLAGEIASHGYIVVGINHPYDVAAVELLDGRIAPYNKDQWLMDPKSHQAYTAERIKVRTADVLFVLDQLVVMNSNTNSHFVGLLDLDSLAAAGHSLGGITASDACKADPRFKACINLDGLQAGGPFSTDVSAVPPHQPFLFLTKESQLHPRLIESFESTNESYWVVIHGASHDNFTDGPMLESFLLPFSKNAVQYMNLTHEYTLLFLDHTLKGSPSSLLSEPGADEGVSVIIFPTR
jgi:hypothetical protein